MKKTYFEPQMRIFPLVHGGGLCYTSTINPDGGESIYDYGETTPTTDWEFDD